MYNSLNGLCDLVDTIEDEQKKERSKPSVERKGFPSEKKYNEYVKDLYKTNTFKNTFKKSNIKKISNIKMNNKKKNK